MNLLYSLLITLLFIQTNLKHFILRTLLYIFECDEAVRLFRAA